MPLPEGLLKVCRMEVTVTELILAISKEPGVSAEDRWVALVALREEINEEIRVLELLMGKPT